MRKELQHQIVNLFRQSDQAMKRVIGKKVEDTGIYRSQHRLLMILGKNPDCSQTAIANKLEISPAAVAVSLKKLEKAGYITRSCDAEDNRMNHVVITDKGKKAIDQSILYFQEIEDAMFEGFSQEELETYAAFLGRVIQNEERYYHNLSQKDNP
ncbi:MAG: MarR family transcriptional regulator [Lachnospiraceae bacterium]|jgi:DNA-binding MarR family transcriptional regulator|nr:hypothetical protein C819_01105 [Lachnospiraceae bacterium 10-1]MCX4350664.1 MarR family transcriptional regulator [Lachnospiraceae bacterium]